MDKPVGRDEIEELNRERPYAVLMGHRGRRGLVAWLLRREPEVCIHTGVGHKTPVAAVRDAEALMEAGVGVILLVDLETKELAGSWLAEPPLLSDAQLAELEDSMRRRLDA